MLKQNCSIPLLDLNEGTLVTVEPLLSGFQGLVLGAATAVIKASRPRWRVTLQMGKSTLHLCKSHISQNTTEMPCG